MKIANYILAIVLLFLFTSCRYTNTIRLDKGTAFTIDNCTFSTTGNVTALGINQIKITGQGFE